MMEEWQMNRAGVINFWYYDDEEFEIESGSLLLRGANGSGKSVTMQSLVPFLFDGNKSPERLDPFGSKARKMESYLLSDGLDLDERTGYLFLEFKKPETGRYITIGMGMRARKNMAMQSWYFIVLDNRRVGSKYDIPLYKNIGDKIPLSLKELENKIGMGGKFFTRQKEYKASVNEHLFGYDDLSDFDELIELLLQIRSPKLSKEFKPTTMYEIMQNSLVTLSDEDLRPMSEAIENMDEIGIRIEALENTQKALSRINNAYSKYNTFMLVQKAGMYIDYYNQERKMISKSKSLSKDLKNQEAQLFLINEEISRLIEEEEQLKQKKASLSEHDLNRLAYEKGQLKEKISTWEKQLAKKEEQVDSLKIRERQLDGDCRESRSNVDKYGKHIFDILSQMNGYAETSMFDEHDFLVAEYNEALENPYNYEFHDLQLQSYKKNIKEGKALILKQESLEADYEASLKDLDDKRKIKAEQEKTLKSTELQFNGIKEEFAEKSFVWSENNKTLKIDKLALNAVVERVFHYGELYRFDQVLEPLNDSYDKFKNIVNSKMSLIEGEKRLVQKELEKKRDEFEELKSQKDPEPERDKKVEKNRKRLESLNIPFIPLYKAIDFEKDLPEELKNRLEEAFFDLGILDALIVMPKYKDQVLEMDNGMGEKYIFAEPDFLSHNISNLFHAEKQSRDMKFDVIDDVLKSIFIDRHDGKLFISDDGYYGMGIIQGKTSGDYKAKFIGLESRKRHKLELMNKISEEISELKSRVRTLQESIEDEKNILVLAKKEFDNFPNGEDLSVAYNELNKCLFELGRFIDHEKEAQEKSEIIYKKLKTVRLEVHDKTRSVQLPISSGDYEEALKDLDVYHEIYHELKLSDQKKWNSKSNLYSLTCQLEQCIGDIEVAIDEVASIERDLEYNNKRVLEIIDELKLSDFQEILLQLEACNERLDEIPKIYKETVEKRANTVSESNQTRKDIEKYDDDLKIINGLKTLHEISFGKELRLGYVEKACEELKLLEQAKQITTAYGDILLEKKGLIDLRDELQEKILKEGGELVEYNLKRIDLFSDLTDGLDDNVRLHIQRIDVVARTMGREVKFYELIDIIEEKINENGTLLDEHDRTLFEDILIKSISRKISSKIYHSEKWVKKIDVLMNNMDTSSGLSFNLKWNTRRAETEDQLSTKELVDILRGEQNLLSSEKREKLIKHFRSKIKESKNRAKDSNEQQSFLSIMKEILDYRKWFEFQLYFTKKGSIKKELTNNAFFTFSGGEKAMAMYVPLFSAVYAKYQGGQADCPKIVSLDEAFAGVDDNNISDMFKLLSELKLRFIANSQVLFGDYETVPSLNIYELIRPENVTFVTLIRYNWNGYVRRLIVED